MQRVGLLPSESWLTRAAMFKDSGIVCTAILPAFHGDVYVVYFGACYAACSGSIQAHLSAFLSALLGDDT